MKVYSIQIYKSLLAPNTRCQSMKSLVSDFIFNKTGTLARVFGLYGVHWSTLQYISVHLCIVIKFIYSSLEYTLRSTWGLNGPAQAKNAQYNLGWVYHSRHMHWYIILTQVIYRERKNYHMTLAETHLLEFCTFHDCLLHVLVKLKLSSMLDTELGYDLLKIDS